MHKLSRMFSCFNNICIRAWLNDYCVASKDRNIVRYYDSKYQQQTLHITGKDELWAVSFVSSNSAKCYVFQHNH